MEICPCSRSEFDLLTSCFSPPIPTFGYGPSFIFLFSHRGGHPGGQADRGTWYAFSSTSPKMKTVWRPLSVYHPKSTPLFLKQPTPASSSGSFFSFHVRSVTLSPAPGAHDRFPCDCTQKLLPPCTGFFFGVFFLTPSHGGLTLTSLYLSAEENLFSSFNGGPFPPTESTSIAFSRFSWAKISFLLQVFLIAVGPVHAN